MTLATRSTPGLLISPSPDTVRARLFCCSYAGGSASAYSAWREAMPGDLELIAIELPGRGRRFSEAPLRSLDAVANHIVELVSPLTDLPFAFYGHSMGAVTALEVSRRLALGGRAPGCLMVSGCAAPHLALRRERKLHDLPRDELVSRLTELEGLPIALLARQDFIDAFLPTIRADMECRENWQSDIFDLGSPIYALGGVQDSFVTESELRAWRQFTSRRFCMKQFAGGHFYIHTAMPEMLAHLVKAIKDCIPVPDREECREFSGH